MRKLGLFLSFVAVLLLFAWSATQGQQTKTGRAYSGMTSYVVPVCGQGRALSGANAVDITPFYVPAELTISTIGVYLNTADAVNSYSFGITTTAGVVVAHTATAATGAFGGNTEERAIVEGTVTLQPGWYILGITGNNTTALFGYTGSVLITAFKTSTTSTSGNFPASLTIAATAAGSEPVNIRGAACMILR